MNAQQVYRAGRCPRLYGCLVQNNSLVTAPEGWSMDVLPTGEYAITPALDDVMPMALGVATLHGSPTKEVPSSALTFVVTWNGSAFLVAPVSSTSGHAVAADFSLLIYAPD